MEAYLLKGYAYNPSAIALPDDALPDLLKGGSGQGGQEQLMNRGLPWPGAAGCVPILRSSARSRALVQSSAGDGQFVLHLTIVFGPNQ
ncbi:hypothetical protein [Halomicronema sp. CCY15110]|uniref:hypothetical protein n=1 Tax=Halomicronema sp. CCY15110 TaxID=2767773 RepID=UPI0019529354|nr:hypothetical protein [Halomicronema sp. CCY15110]